MPGFRPAWLSFGSLGSIECHTMKRILINGLILIAAICTGLFAVWFMSSILALSEAQVLCISMLLLTAVCISGVIYSRTYH